MLIFMFFIRNVFLWGKNVFISNQMLKALFGITELDTLNNGIAAMHISYPIVADKRGYMEIS